METGRFQIAPAVRGDDDTSPGLCPLCAARANLDAALVRAGVERLTLVSEYIRPRVGPAALERAKALACFYGSQIVLGEGHSREEAIAEVLEKVGVTL